MDMEECEVRQGELAYGVNDIARGQDDVQLSLVVFGSLVMYCRGRWLFVIKRNCAKYAIDEDGPRVFFFCWFMQ